MSENEIRQNKATGEWVVFAPKRGQRPKEIEGCSNGGVDLPEWDEDCPFCPGHEASMGPVLLEMKGGKGSWQTRTIPNKFPALRPVGTPERVARGIYVAMEGYGRHEVVIDSPLHNQAIVQMDVETISTVIETYHRRCLDLMKDDAVRWIVVFRNHGPRSGTSIVHPHSQIIASSVLPAQTRLRETEAERYFDEWGRCVYCDILQYELGEKTRLVFENDSFAAFVPFAAESPCETWIVPLAHSADFAAVSEREKVDLAAALKAILEKFHRHLDDPDYNYAILSSSRCPTKGPQLHWLLQIKPRLTEAGIEIGAGVTINTSMPEEDAALLRGE